MQKRTNESPMDFEWQTTAPGDVTSPFYQLAMEHEKQKKKREELAMVTRICTLVPGSADSSCSSGPFSVFDSPSKPSSPAVTHETNSQRFLFSQPSGATPAFPTSSAFATPRKVNFDFSSGAENSPDAHLNADDTPEQPSKSERRNSLFNFYGRFAPSPGRGEIPRTNKFSNVVIQRVQKRRKRGREVEKHMRKASMASESSSRSPSRERHSTRRHTPREEQQKSQDIPFFSRLFTFLESHPHIPRILSYYAQFAFNLVLAFLGLYVIVTFLLAIHHDITRERDRVSEGILAEMAACARNYVENRCSGESGKRLPALETVCNNWERCMNQDPAKVGKAKVSAQTLAEIFNSFIEPISFKTMIFFIASITSCVAVSNLTFSFFRNKSNNPPEPVSSYRPYAPPGMNSQPSHLTYATGHTAFGMGGPFYGHHPMHHASQAFNQSPFKSKPDYEDEPRRQIDMRPFDGHMGTPSPSKRDVKFS
ncbi:predicted protein [Uncinocarpus reesii 1704]|uniref:Brl1/Brr6 domain-containing protein n=1 Tax=Uncinocarpus reesii (strain UAMH 1704) TaxID=336963 RepID=C4JFH2_UNCRE|nr:uncharacterized protein UREG_00986 [Uncinocarpus reesii 1704]EEP76137.1 predicted protein [Uncinocarpus reesii 1704]